MRYNFTTAGFEFNDIHIFLPFALIKTYRYRRT